MKHNRFFVWVFMVIASTHFVFATIPGVPTNINARLDGSSIILTWQAPTSGGTPTGYKLYYDGDSYHNSYRDPQFTVRTMVTGTSKSVLVSSLDPSFNIHAFAVSAYNSSGESSLSEGEYTLLSMDYNTGDTVLLTGDGTSNFMAIAQTELHQEIDIYSQNDTVIFPPLNIGILLNKSAIVQYSFKTNPAGMTLDNKTGAVTYIAPNAIGTYSAIVVASWQSMRLEIPVTVSVFQSPDLEFVDYPVMVARSGSLFRTQLTARHKSDPTAVIRYELSPNSPSGMTIDSVSGVMEYRVPSNDKETAIDITVLARCQGNCIGIYGDFQLIVTEKRVKAYGTPIGSAVVGTSFGFNSSQISIYAQDVAGGSGSFQFSLVNAPSGMKLVDGDSAYTWVKYIDWTPTQVGTYAFDVIVKGINGVWGSDTVRYEVVIYDTYTVSNLAPSFTDVNQTMTYLPIVKNSSGDIVTNLRFEPTIITTLNTELEIVDPDYFTNGIVEFDSTNGKLRWTPVATGFLYFTGNILDGDRVVAYYYAKVYSFDLSKVDTAEIVFATFPNTVIKPGQQWQYSPSMVNKYLGTQLEASFSLDQGPAGMVVDSSSYFTWTPTSTGIYEVVIEAQTANNKKDMQPFMILVANNYEPNNMNGKFNMYPYNWCQVGENIKNAYGIGIDFLNRFEVAVLDSTQEDIDLSEVRYILEEGPAGMSIDSVTGVVDWTPTQQGVWDVTVKAFYPNKEGVARVTLSFFAFDMPEKTVSMLVKRSPKKVTSVETEQNRISAKLSVAPMPARDIRPLS